MKATFYSKSKQTLALLLLCFGIVTLLPAQTTIITQAWATLASGASPQSIAIDVSGNVYTANGNNTVSKITSAGGVTQAWASLASGAYAQGIAIDASGNVYTANGNNTVSKITSAGVVTQTWAALALGANPQGIAIDVSGNVYTSNANSTVSKITSARVVTQTWATLASGANPNDIAIDVSGNVYTANRGNNTVSKITSAGVVTQTWAALASGATTNGIAIDASGNIYTANLSNNTVSKITSAGVVTQTWAALALGANPYRIAVDASGNVYTPNLSHNTVSKITSAGGVTQTWAALASGASPRDIAIDASGNVYTANSTNNTISKILICTTTVTPSVAIAVTTGSQTTCAGASVTFTATPTNGGTTPTYQWRKNGTNVSGETSATYTSTTLANNDAITCVLTSNDACATTPTATSNSLTMTVPSNVTPSVTIAITAGSQTTCAGTSVTFTATPTNGGTTPTYQWLKNGTDISGATSATFTSSTLAQADIITCVLTSNATCPNPTTATSNSLTMTVTPLVTPSVAIAITAGSQTICAGSSVTFTATPTNGGTTPTYQWRKNGTDISGETNATFTSTTLANTDAITCVLTSNATCPNPTTATSNSLTMTVNAIVTPSVAIAITAGSQTICAGSSVTFTATPTNGGTTPTYQWLKNGTDISGATSATFTSTTLAQADIITCVLTSNATCPNPTTATSNSLTMTVNAIVTPSVAIAVTTGSQTTCSSASVTFTATPTNGGTTPTYQWRKNATNISGATSATYTSTTLANNDAITCVLTSNVPCATTPTATSNSLTMTVTPTVTPSVAIAITTGSQTICSGTSVTFTATPTNGGTTPTYQWRKNGTDISGATSSTFTSTTLAQADIITCVLTSNATCPNPTTATSNSLTMTVNPIVTPSVAIAATATTISGGASVTFTATPTNGGTTPTYQWKKGGVNISGATNAAYTSTTLANGDVITCVMTSNATCLSPTTATSNAITMTVTAPLAAALDFDGVNDHVALPAAVYFNGNLTIEAWVYPKSQAAGSRIIDFGNNSTSNSVILTIAESGNGMPKFSVDGRDVYATKKLLLNRWSHVAVTLNGTTATFYINGVASGIGTINTPPNNIVRNNCYIGRSNLATVPYANASMDEVRIWSRALPQCEIQNNMNGELGSGQTGLVAYYKFNQGGINSNNAAITTLTDASGNNYHGTLNGFGLTSTSSNWIAQGGVAQGATSPTYTPPSVSVSNATTCINTPATLTATLSGFAATATYQWETSTDNTTWRVLAGATTTTYSPASITAGTSYYRIKVTDVCGVVYATGATFTVINHRLTVTADATRVCQNSVATLTAATVTGAPTYQWQSSTNGSTWANVSGATSATFTPATSTIGVAYYRVVASYGSGCTLNSTPQILTVGAAPTVAATGGNVTVGQGSTSAKLTGVINAPYASVFQWQSSADGLTAWTDIVDADGLTYPPSTANVGTLHYRLKVSFAATGSVCNATIYSNVRRISVTAAPSVNIMAVPNIASGAVYCSGTSLSLNSTCSDNTATPTWTGPNGFTASTANISFSQLSAAQAGEYRVTYLTATGNLGEKSFFINIEPELAVAKTVSATAIVAGNPAQIAVTGTYKGVLAKLKFDAKTLTTSSLAEGSTPTFGTDNGSINQQWVLIPVSSDSLDLNPSVAQRFYIQSLYSGLYLTSSAIDRTIVTMAAQRNSPNVEWYLTQTNNGLTSLRNSNLYQFDDKAVKLNTSQTTQTIPLVVTPLTPNPSLAWENASTGATRTVSPTATTDYIATFTNSRGCIIKDTTSIAVLPGTIISIVPSGDIPAGNQQRLLATNVCQGKPLTLTAAVSNNGASPTYKWQRSTNGTTWFDIAGVTSLTYSSPTDIIGTTFYRAIVTNRLGVFTSAAAEILVIAVPTVSIATSQAIVCLNATPTLTAGYTAGFGTPTIRWQSSPDNTTWTNIATATAETYQPVTTTAGKIYYRYIATFIGSCPTFTSEGIAITVKPTFTAAITGAATQTVCQGSYRFFTLSSNDATATFAWQSSTNGTTWTTIANATSASYVAPTSTVGTTHYRGIVSAAGCSVTSATRQITTTAVPTITVASPYSQVCVGTSVSFKATLSGTTAGSPAFVWQTSNNNLNWATKTTGGTTYSPSAATVGSTFVRVGVKFATCADSTFSLPQTLVSTANPIVTVSVNPTAPCSNAATVLAANLIGGSGSPTYQWQKATSLLNASWSNIAGATSSSYTLPAATASSNYRVQVKYNTTCPVVSSQGQSVTPKTAPSVTIAASGTAICQGSPVSLTTTITNNAGVVYQWQSSPTGATWTDIAGATTASYSYTAATVGSTQYRLKVLAKGCSEVVSAPTTVAVSSNAVPTLAIAADNLTVCDAADVVITATPANLNGASPQYEWLRNGELFAGQPTAFVTKSTANGLSSNSIIDIAVSRNYVYLATENGLDVSSDGGVTFTNKFLNTSYGAGKITALGLNPDNEGSIIIGQEYGSLYSENAGNSFTKLGYREGSREYGNENSTDIKSIGVSPWGSMLYLANKDKELFVHHFGDQYFDDKLKLEFDEVGDYQFGEHYFDDDSPIIKLDEVDDYQDQEVNSIILTGRTYAYLLTTDGIKVAYWKNHSRLYDDETGYEISEIADLYTSAEGPTRSNFTRGALRGDTLFAINSTSGLNYYIEWGTSHEDDDESGSIELQRYSVTGLPAPHTLKDVLVQDNLVYVTATSGLYFSKDGGNSFSDITSSVGLEPNPGLDRMASWGRSLYITSSKGLRIASFPPNKLKFTPNKSDLIECRMTTTAGCTNTVSKLLTVNYIGGVDPTSIKVAVDGTTGTGTWTAVNSATGYGWELSKFSPDRSTKTFVKNGTVTTNKVTLTDLTPLENYELTVKTLSTISPSAGSSGFARFARLADVTCAGAGGSTSFTTGFVVPQAIKDALAKLSNVCAEDNLVLGPGFPDGYEVRLYYGTNKLYIGVASAASPLRVYLTANTTYFYQVFQSNVKTYTLTASNNDAGRESKLYTVPTGVSKITFKIGGSKGESIGVSGGSGGVTTGTVTPTVGTIYHLFPGTTTTADAGIAAGLGIGSGGGGSYISTTSLRKGAIMVAGGGGGGPLGGNGGLRGTNGGGAFINGSPATGGTATKGGVSVSRPNQNVIKASGFMQGSSTGGSTLAAYGGGGGFYGGGSYLDINSSSAAGGGGGSSYANTNVVKDIVYETGANFGTGYVSVSEHYQVPANSDLLPLDVVVMPAPILEELTSTSVLNGAGNTTKKLTVSMPVTTLGATTAMTFETSYAWTNQPDNRNYTFVPATGGANPRTHSCTVTLKYCNNRQKSKSISFQSSQITGGGGGTTNSRLLTPTVSIAASTNNICAGEQVSFTATPTDIADENLFYRWYKNGELLGGESNNVLQTRNVSNNDVVTCTLFYPTATNSFDTVASTNNVIMTVATPATPSVTIAASANDVCPSTAITFTPTPTAGGTSPQYKWYLNGDLVQTSPTYTSSSFENSDYVACIMASNATCLAQTESEISAPVSVNLKPLATPTATVFVLDTLICSSGTTRLSVGTKDAGTTPLYQWRHNGAPVGNNVDYAPVSVSQNDAIWCEVTPSADACANTSFVQSNTELIQKADADAVFTPLATITVDKDSICTGDSLTFSVEGNYLGNTPQYVWKKNGTNLAGTDPFITLANIANGDIITCVATSSLTCVSAATATSNALTAKVVTPATPTVSISTPNTTICPNLPVVISATPSYGGSYPVYNWRLNGQAHNALPHEFFNYTIDDGLRSNTTKAVFVHNDTVFVATPGGLSYRFPGQSVYKTLANKGLATSNVKAIYADNSGIYAGTSDGLSISTDGLVSFRPINTSGVGFSRGNITAITSIGSTLFVGTDNGLNISTDGGNSFTSKKTTEGLASNRIRHLFVDGTTLYVGTEGGLNITTNDGTTFITKTIADSLNSDTVLGVWAKGAAIYAATQQGLAVSNDGGTSFTKLTMENGLPNLQVNGVWVVADSMVYAATSSGLGISKNGGKTFRGYYETDSLGSNNVLGVTVAGGRIYAATASGLSVSDPSKIRVYPNDGDVFATNLASNKSCVATSTATSNNLTFFVGAVSAASLDATIVRNTSATLTWTGTTGSYNWRIVPTGTGLDGTVVASGTTATMPITATGLTVLTTYDLFVQGACTPDGTVNWVGPLTFTTTNNAFVSVKTLLHGAYDATTGLMNDNLRSLNLVPTTEPYTGMTGFTHVNGGSGEKTSSTVLAVTGNDAIVDWVFVELRDKMTSGTVIATRSALIQRDGDVVDVDGISPVSFNVASDDYYISVRHRNHLGVRTASAVTLDKVTAAPYDFTTAANKALNSIQKDLTGGKFGMYAGNINGDNVVRASGSLSINDYLKLIGLLGSSSSIQTNVYSVGDVNMDGTMRASGSLTLNDYLKIINAIGSAAGIVTQPF